MDILIKEFPFIRELDTEFYTNEPYKSNHLRKSKILILLGSMLNYEEFRKLPHQTQNKIAKAIETGCVNATIRKSKEDNLSCSWQTSAFVARYNNIIYEKANELNCNNNQYLLPKIISNEINPSDISHMSNEELNPIQNKELLKLADERRNQVIQYKESDAFECPKCSKNRTNYIPVQLRSGDEGKNLKIFCLECGWDWVE